jgi:hypothetical protein
MVEGYVQDVVTLIVNVEWGGLAVEFGDKDGPEVEEPEPS